MDPRFPAGLPFPVPEILEFVAFGASGKIFQQFSRDFPGVFLENPRTDPAAFSSFLTQSVGSRGDNLDSGVLERLVAVTVPEENAVVLFLKFRTHLQ